MMSNLNAQKATEIVRKYFDSVKKIKYLFEPINAVQNGDGVWVVECEIQNIFDKKPKHYKVLIDDKTGDILEVSNIE